MTEQQPKYTFDRVVRMVLTAVTIIGLVLLLRYLSDVLVPFAAAVVLAYLLNPIVNAFDKRTGRRGVAVAITLAGVGIVAATMVAIFIPLVASQVGRFRSSLETLRQDMTAPVHAAISITDEHRSPSPSPSPSPSSPSPSNPSKTATSDSTHQDSTQQEMSGEPSAEKTVLGFTELREGWRRYREQAGELKRSERIGLLMHELEGTWLGDGLSYGIDYVQSDEFKSWAVGTGKRLLAGGWSVVALGLNFLLGLTVLIIVLLYLVFLLLDYPTFAQTWRTFLPPQYRDSIVEFLVQFNTAMGRYFRGQALIAISMAVLFSVGFSIISLPMALILGLFVGALNMVPYLQTIGLVPAVLLAGMSAIESDSSFLLSIVLVLAVFAVAQLVQDAVLTPRIMGKATGLSPVAILLGVFIWGKLLGFLGLILAIPLTCLCIAYYRRYVLSRAEAHV